MPFRIAFKLKWNRLLLPKHTGIIITSSIAIIGYIISDIKINRSNTIIGVIIIRPTNSSINWY